MRVLTAYRKLAPGKRELRTEDYDRGTNLTHYQSIPSLREYLVAAQSEARVDRYSRQPDHTWNLATAVGLEARVSLPGVDCELLLSEVYALTQVAATSG